MSNVETLAQLIQDAESVVVFTGAGISTESGIPDFRSPGGVWSTMKPIYFQDFVASEEWRKQAWDRVYNRAAGWVGKEPNAGHFAIANLVKRGKIPCVITQNVDNLHQDSGVPDYKVIEVHGNASYAKCLSCSKRYEYEDLRPRWEAGEDITCIFCAGLLKSATISFGQPMPEDKMEAAADMSEACDLFIVFGSSLSVYPAAGLPLLAKKHGAKLVIVNRDPTEQDSYADLVLNTEIGPLMSDVLSRLP